MEINNGNKYEIYIGLKDKDTYEEIFDEKTFATVLGKICTNHKIAFSLTTQVGGYAHNKGYVTETSLRITLIGIDKEELKKLALALKELVNTDTLLITREDIEFIYC